MVAGLIQYEGHLLLVATVAAASSFYQFDVDTAIARDGMPRTG